MLNFLIKYESQLDLLRDPEIINENQSLNF